jgi:nucleotide-binding universal stress UspA family protein
MTTIVSCVDGSLASTAVCDAGAWVSRRLNLPLLLLHVLEKSTSPAKVDFSGNIGLGSREHLLEELVALDEKRGRLALEHGKRLLVAARRCVQDNGAIDVTTLARHERLLDTLLELESDIGLLIMGKQGNDHSRATDTLGSHLESVIRGVHRPVLVVTPDFTPPERFLLAFDGSVTAQRVLEMVATSPLLKGLVCHLVMVGHATLEDEAALASAADKLTTAGFAVSKQRLDGEVPRALHHYQHEHGIELMVMGAYGHSRIRQFFIGSVTANMLSSSKIPLLLLR